jgi:hypothetical protein
MAIRWLGVARRPVALFVLSAGILLIVAARLALPAAPPLYDGIVPIEPYLWLDPPRGDPGGAKGANAEVAVRGGKSPLVAVATAELEPQAQIFAPPGGLSVQPGTRTVKVSIEPIPAEGAPTDGHIDGNVYRITVIDDTGTALSAPESARVSIVLRATDPAQAEATVERFSAGSWQTLKTSPSGFGGSFLSVVTEFGDYAVIVPGPGPSSLATQPGAASTESSGSAATGSNAPAGASSTPIVPPSSPGESSGLAGWLVLLAAAALAVAIVGYRIRRGRGDPYSRARRTRRR